MGVTITGTGSFIPTGIAKNERFENNTFLTKTAPLSGRKMKLLLKNLKQLQALLKDGI